MISNPNLFFWIHFQVWMCTVFPLVSLTHLWKLSLYSSLDSFIIHIDGGNPLRGPPEFSFGKKPLNKNMGGKGKYLSTTIFHRIVEPSSNNHGLTMTLYPTISIIIISSLGEQTQYDYDGEVECGCKLPSLEHHREHVSRQQRKVHHVHVKKPFVGWHIAGDSQIRLSLTTTKR